ncbi:hypothetical protein EUX98_g3519 [Antrodiella citrinella]|uniref:Nuclear condensin complex subunit 3 C-terminal domain-containing protein n=1 Tax=Antrodiella citrinella TaxID=2447956 RepID=A0A4S4MYC9_9APHY|nr:hypothetical protein EUX98_g3519 [Antrodiella citrinella]
MAPNNSIDLSSLPQIIAVIFDQAQVSTANHRKNCVALHKIHVQSSLVTSQEGNNVRLTGERAFSDIFVDMLNRVLVIKKGPTPADRVVRFVGVYVKFMTEKALELRLTHKSEALSAAPDEDEDDTPTTRFIARLLSYCLKGFIAKDKTVRFRSVSIVAELISHLGELDLMERARDKESAIRAHAVTALSKLLSGEDSEDLQDDETSILDTMLHSLCHDSATDVRRIALLNTPLSPETLPVLLSRTRDVDVAVRTLLYAHTLLPVDSTSASTSRAARNTIINPNRLNNPRQLSIEQRERVVRDGLGDREGKVRAGAAKMLAGWFDWAADNAGSEGEEKTISSLLVFLKLFDVVSDGGDLVAVDALKSVFVTRPDVFDAVVFQDKYWRSLTPESALLARAFIEHSDSAHTQESRLEAAALPVVTAFAFYVQEACNAIFDSMETLEEARFADDADKEDEEFEKLEADLVDRVFILSEVLKIAAKLDYTDEIGRRKVFQVVRDILAHELLPEHLLDSCLDVLKETTPSEREIIRIVVEIINELRDSATEDGADFHDQNHSRPAEESMDASQSQDTSQSINESRIMRRQKQPQEMSPEERAQADTIDARCLALCIASLKHVNGSFDENSTLEGVLTDLIIPAVKRRELLLRERGLISLGLCCLIAKNMAMSSFQLFLNQVQTASEELKVKVLQVIFDILMVYEEELLRRNEDVCAPDNQADRIVTFLLQTLEVEESHAVQALLCIGISKLMINGLITDERVLASLVLAYVSPVTSENEELRQCLAYFLPVYCYSLPSNQMRMRSIFLTAFELVSKVFEELDADQEMITPLQFGNLFVDWTNPLKAAPTENPETVVNDVHVDLAIELVKALFDKERSGTQSHSSSITRALKRIGTDNDIKVFCQLLVKLYIPDSPEPLGLLCLGTLLEHLNEDVEDTATAKLLVRFKARFKKQFGRELERVKADVGTYATSEEYKEVCEVVGIDVPEGDEEGGRGADELVSNDQEVEEEEEEEEEEELESEVLPPKRGHRRRPEEDQSEEDQDDDSVRSRSALTSRSPTPSPSHQKKRAPPPPVPDDARSSAPLESPPSTPRRKRQPSKRVRSPIKSPTMLSPVHKRVHTAQSPRKPRTGNGVPADPFLDATNSFVPVQKGNVQRRTESAPQADEDEDEEEEVEEEDVQDQEASDLPSDDDESDEPVPVHPKKRPAAKLAKAKSASSRRPAVPDFDSSSEP